MKPGSLITEKLGDFGSLQLSFLPTPIHRLNNISDVTGINLYCMRDDLTGFAYGGNKTRKLDYIMHKAVEEGYDSVVTFGSNQSNWCRMTSAAGAYLGMDVYMVFDGEEPTTPSGNLILDRLVGAKIEYLNCNDPLVIENYSKSLADKLREKGHNPLYIPVGGSTPIGTLGYLNAFNEILHFSFKSETDFEKIYVATGSAGTQAGLVVGKILSGWAGEIIGISVGREKDEQEEMIYSLVQDTLRMLGEEESTYRNMVRVRDDYYGKGYRQNTQEAGDAIRLFASKEGIFLDEVYTGKAASGMLEEISKGEVSDNENILFIHTGGGVQLFE